MFCKKNYTVALILASALVLIALSATVIQAASGGPDGLGYTYRDSNESGGPTYSFDTLTDPITLTLGDDEISAAIPLGFDFSYYGSTYSNTYIASNGFLTVLSGQSATFTPQQLPNSLNPNGIIAGWWVNLDPTLGGTIRYQTLGAAPQRRFIVEFTNIQRKATTYLVTLQFKLFESSNLIEVHYQQGGSDFASYSTGIENQTGTVGLQYYRGTTALTTPLAVRYTPPADLSLSQAVTPTTVTPGQAITYTLRYTNTGPGPAEGVVITDVLPTALTNVNYASSGSAITSTGQTWQVAPLAPGSGGLITVTGLVSPNLQGVSDFTNTAIITTTAIDMNADNNSSMTTVAVRYGLTADRAGNGAGTVNITPSGSTFSNGTVVTLTATPHVGSSFTGWSPNCTLMSGACVVTISANTLVTATFTLIEYNLTVNTVGSGSVLSSPAQSTYHYGDVVTLTAVPDTFWTFEEWSGAVTSLDNPAQIIISGDTSITATFKACVPIVSADFTYTPTTPQVGQPVSFTAVITGGTLPVTYTWNFGHGADIIITTTSVVHNFPLSTALQAYSVTLMTANVCSSISATPRLVSVLPYRLYLPLILR